MACDTTYQHLARRQAAEGAARLMGHTHQCICDCAVVEAVNWADRNRYRATPAPAANPPACAE